MKTNKLLKKLKNYLYTERRERIAKVEAIKKILKKLKKKENLLKDDIKKEHDKKTKKRLKEKMRVLTAQRKKGVKLLKELRMK